MDAKPLVSVGMPVYNEARWLRQSLDALLSQTFADFELIVSDNASTDDTWDILREYAAKDKRVVLHRQAENIGAANFEFVLDEAQGDYFMWAAGHDMWSANLLGTLASELQAHPGAGLCVPQAVLMDENDKAIRSYEEPIDTRAAKSAADRVLILIRGMERCNAFYGLHRRCVLQKVFPWPKVVGNDFIVLTRIASMGDVITNGSAQWLRRNNREMASQERIQRYLHVHGIKGLAATFPYLFGRVMMMVEFSKASGPFSDRAALLGYGLRKLFLQPAQFRLLLQEFLAGIGLPLPYRAG